MKKSLAIALTAFLSISAFAVSVQETADSIIVKNDNYTVNFKKKNSAAMTFTQLGKKAVRQSINAHPIISVSGEREKYAGTYAADDVKLYDGGAKTSAKLVSSSDEQVVVETAFSFFGGNYVQKVTMDNTNVIRYDITLKSLNARLGRFEYRVNMTMQNDSTGIFYPEQKRAVTVWMSAADYVEGESWKYAWFEKSKLGMGVVVLPGKYSSGIEYGMQNRKEGWHSDYGSVRAVYSPLQGYGKNHTFDFSYLLIAGGTPELARTEADKALKKQESVKFFSYEAEKLTVRPGQDNNLKTVIWNTTKSAADLTAKTYAIYDLDTEKLISTVNVKVGAGEFKPFDIALDLPAEAERGVAIRTELFDAKGNLLDKKTDFCAVTDFSPRDTGFGIINAGQANNQEGSQEGWNRKFKKNYVGAYEYYCWAPSTIFGLAPKEDEWLTGTEAGYDTPVTKKFVKGLVDNAHSMGVGVYTWITGLWNYNIGIQHPEWLQYCANGQPNIYNGGIRRTGIRRMTLKPNVYTEERARIWGEEMADSVDMFGWDGCRWDFSFLPGKANDPLFVDDSVGCWYDHNGVPSNQLYPDSDKTGAACLKAWREAVEKRHPNFVYGTNIGITEKTRSECFEHMKTASTRGMLLFEDMLNFSNRQYNTFEKWGRELALRTDVVRPYEAAPVVGAMRGLPTNSVSYHLAQYTSASAGVKWWAYASCALAERSPERNRYLLRFARYYFGCDFLRPAKLSVSQDGNQKVLFDPFVRERKTKDGREIVIPVVNMPESNDYICEYHDVPPVRKNVVFKVALAKGETASAWLMTPQNPEKAVKLAVKDGKVTIPELTDACMVLIQCKGGK